MDKSKVNNTSQRITMYYIWELLTEIAKAMNATAPNENLAAKIESQKEALETEKKHLAFTAIDELLELLQSRMDEKDDE